MTYEALAPPPPSMEVVRPLAPPSHSMEVVRPDGEVRAVALAPAIAQAPPVPVPAMRMAHVSSQTLGLLRRLCTMVHMVCSVIDIDYGFTSQVSQVVKSSHT